MLSCCDNEMIETHDSEGTHILVCYECERVEVIETMLKETFRHVRKELIILRKNLTESTGPR